MNTNTIENITEKQTEKHIGLNAAMGQQTKALLENFNTGEDTSIFDFSIEQAREIFNPIFKSSAAQHLPIAEEIHKTIEYDDLTVPIIELTPIGNAPVNGWPVLLFLHGGGWILGDYPSYEGFAKAICNYTKAKVFFVDYALSPESRYPLALKQVSTTLKWLNSQHGKLNINVKRIGVLGDSAGGNLAAALCLFNQQTTNPMAIKLQCLIYPLLDLSLNAEYSSRTTCGDGEFFLSRDHINWSRNHYLSESLQGDNALVSPIKSDDLQELPNSIIVTAGFDPLQSEAKAYHQNLLSAGNNSLLIHFPSTIHGFLSFSANLDIANTGIKHICQRIKKHL